MSSIMCGNRSCKYNGGRFCKNDFIFLNAGGQCKVWFDENGQFRGQPLYPAEGMSVDATKQSFPKNNEGFEEKLNDAENADSSKKDEKREDK